MEAENDNASNKKSRLDIDFDKFDADDEAPPELVVVPASKVEDRECAGEDFGSMPDYKLEEAIASCQKSLMFASKCADKGAKMKARIDRLIQEQKRREQLRCVELHHNGSNTPASSSRLGGALREPGTGAGPSGRSVYGACFEKKLEQDKNPRICNSFPEPQVLAPRNKKQQKHSQMNGREKRGLSLNGRRKNAWQSCSRQAPREKDGHQLSHCQRTDRGNMSYDFRPRKRYACLGSLLDGSMAEKESTILLVDEDEPPSVEPIESVEEVLLCYAETKICYPSSEDPESVEIRYDDIKCLDPGTYLTSPIMNFYIRYLQEESSPGDRPCPNYHFFNTYFYKKLQEAVTDEKCEKFVAFKKFRRWWKGLNIFEKEYIFLPIHEELHWSLAIICIPEKEDESGPIILHLDSLGYHSSRSIFDNVKRFLIKEKNYLSEEADALDTPFAERIWENIPDKVDEKIIKVPQQNNDSDCGLFVLYFMEKLIVEASERLKKQRLTKLGRSWFQPEEASSLRKKIRRILVDKFQKSIENKSASSPSSSASSGDTKTAYHLEVL